MTDQDKIEKARDADNKKALDATVFRIDAWENVVKSKAAKSFEVRRAQEELSYLRMVHRALTTPAPQSEKMEGAIKVLQSALFHQEHNTVISKKSIVYALIKKALSILTKESNNEQ